MRKTATVALVALVVLLLGTSGVLYQKYQKTSANLSEMKVADEAARQRDAAAFSAIAEIQDSLSAISLAEPSLQARSEGQPGPNRQEILDRIATLKESIQRTKDKIRQLDASSRQRGVKIAGLEKLIANLKTTVAGKEELITQLTTQMESLQTQVAGLETTVQQDQQTIVAKDQTIDEKQRELGTIFYVIGTKKELANSGLIESKGGVLGMGKTLQLTGKYDESRFTALNTDQETVVRAPATKVQVLSPQPTSSYELVVAGNQVELHILDPKEFRKVKHLVIMTT